MGKSTNTETLLILTVAFKPTVIYQRLLIDLCTLEIGLLKPAFGMCKNYRGAMW